MADDDKRGPRFPTPASGVRSTRAATEGGAQTERTLRAQVEAAARADREASAREEMRLEAARIERLRGMREEETTPVNMPLPVALVRTAERARATQSTALDIQTRVGVLEGGLKDARHEIGYVAQQVSGLEAGVEVLVEEAKESRRERQERERVAEARATAELAFRRERALKIITIVVPTLTALGAIIAGLAGAFR